MKLYKKTFEKRFIAAMMKKGKYIKAEQLFYVLLNRLKTNGIKNPYYFFRKAIIQMTPVMGISTKKIGSRDFYFLKFYDQRHADKIAIKWLFEKIKKKKHAQFLEHIELELRNAFKGRGTIIQKKWELYKDVRFASSKDDNKVIQPLSFAQKKEKQLIRKKWK